LHLLEAGVDPAAGADAAAAGADDPAAGADDPAASADAAAASADDPAERSAPDGPEVTAGPSPEDLRVVEREACLVAQRVKDMVEGPAPLLIWDKNAETYRPVRYRDIAVLMRATTGLANQVLEAFARMGAPAYAHLSAGYFAAVEVETALSLLRLIDNPRQDIPLAAVLRSSIVGLDEADLARIRLSFRPGDFYDAVRATAAGAAVDPAVGPAVDSTVDPVLASRLRTFLERLETWRDAARRGPLSELVWRLLRETGFYAHTGGLPNGAQRQANLRGLHDRARLFDQFSRQGLARFLRFLDRLRESEGDLGPPPPLGEGEDAVSVLSIHRAKGQEFPVVFLIHLGKKFNLSDARGDLLCHRALGLGPAVVDPIRRLKYPSLAGRAVSQARRADAVAEEMRCLYVGMTRARDCLVLVGSKRNLASGLGRWCLPESAASGEAGAPGVSASPEARPRLTTARVAGARTYLDWIVPAVAAHPEAAPLRSISGYGPGSLADPSRWEISLWGLPGFPEVTTLAEPPLSRQAGEVNWDRIADLAPLPEVANGPLRAGLDWVYPAARLSLLPAKIAPSELKRLWQRGLDEDAVTRPTPAGATRPAFLREAPAGLTSAEKGQATHLLLRHADLSGPLDEEALSALAETLADREVMTSAEAQGADVKAVARFFSSELGGWLLSSRDRVRREVPFTLGLPAAEVYGSGTDWPGVKSAEARATEPSSAEPPAAETVLIQGIIDAIVDEPDGLTILDFKTDAIAADEAVARAETYRPQVELYRRAVETIWNRPVKAVVLCFLSPGRAVRVAKGGETAPYPQTKLSKSLG
jgi:ATP-dependent helicase/nuclease subunit A